MRWSVALIVVCALLFSGCTGRLPGCVPPASGNQVPLSAPSTNDGEYTDTWRIFVLNASDATPIEGAGVAILWNRDPIDQGSDSPPTNPPLELTQLRTDDRGLVVVHVPQERYLIASVAAPGYTEEWTSLDYARAGRDDSIVGLYPLRMSFSWTGSVTAQDAALMSSGATSNWLAQPVPWTDAHVADLDNGFVGRLETLNLTVSWTNGLTERTTFYTAWGTDHNNAITKGHGTNVPDGMGAHTTSEEFDPGLHPGLNDDPPVVADSLYVGPYAERPFVAVNDVAYSFRAVATFTHREWKAASCGILFAESPIEPARSHQGWRAPGVDLWAVTGVLVLAAVVVRRRSQL